MGSLFGDSGPSSSDIARQEERARLAEVERLRIQEQKMRRRVSRETIQGDGLSIAADITLGDDDVEEGSTDRINNDNRSAQLAEDARTPEQLQSDFSEQVGGVGLGGTAGQLKGTIAASIEDGVALDLGRFNSNGALI